MKNFLVIVIFFFCSWGCQKQEIDFTKSIKEIFNLLPEIKSYDNQGQYKFLIDTINTNSIAYYHVSGKLFYQQSLLWQADSTYLLDACENNDLFFLKNTYALIGSFESHLFYQGIDITAKVTPDGFPLISEVRSNGDIIYLLYADYGTFRRHEENRYSSFNLITGKLEAE